MFNPALVDSVARMLMESDRGQLNDLHKPLVDAFKESDNFHRLVVTQVIPMTVIPILRGDTISTIAALLVLVELGYKIKATEELEESFSK